MAIALLVLTGCQQEEEVTTGDLETVASLTADQIQPRFQALGTEPFWSIEVLAGELKYSSPDNLQGTRFPFVVTRPNAGWRYVGALQGKQVVLSIVPAQCSDGMSDTAYVYKASFTWGDRTEHGCARLK